MLVFLGEGGGGGGVNIVIVLDMKPKMKEITLYKSIWDIIITSEVMLYKDERKGWRRDRE